MMFQSFNDVFPAIAEKETRIITLLSNNKYGLPADSYLFVELFCNDPKCDCRRAMFQVFSLSNNESLATICWGWESASFYVKWLGLNDKEMIKELKGPALNTGSYQSAKATILLKLFSELLLPDAAFTMRVKEHYSTFKRKSK